MMKNIYASWYLQIPNINSMLTERENPIQLFVEIGRVSLLEKVSAISKIDKFGTFILSFFFLNEIGLLNAATLTV
jgi:hypothetical protein